MPERLTVGSIVSVNYREQMRPHEGWSKRGGLYESGTLIIR
jgi:hypothetical protein